MPEKLYTEEQFQKELQLRLIENNQSHAFKSLERLESSMKALEKKIDNFIHWCIGLMIVQFCFILAEIFILKVKN